MSVLVTGAGGFIGQAVVQRLLAAGSRVIAFDRNLSSLPEDVNILRVEGDLTDGVKVAACFEAGAEKFIHLAALPGGAAEQDPISSFKTNVEATTALMHRAADLGGSPRFVFASTIAVLGDPLPEDGVNDATPLRPKMYYGMHKQMAEIALATMSRRGILDGVGVRLPGIVARPSGASGMKSAFMSDVFHALNASQPYEIPVSELAQLWVMSVSQCADNLVKALTIDSSLMPEQRVVTFPAVRVGMAELVEAIASDRGASIASVSYNPDTALEAGFGAHPTLDTSAAEAAGFRHDGGASALVANVFKHMNSV